MDQFLDKYVFPYTQRYIGRAKKTKDGLPIYTKREELFNMISHIIGIFIGFGMIIATLYTHHSDWGLYGGIIFGISLIILYGASSVYHGLPMELVEEKKIFRLLDHCSIFILIAGTCTPFILSLVYLRSVAFEWIFYAIIWFLAFGGITLLCVNMKRFKSITVVMYVVMGGLIVIRADIFAQFIEKTGVALMVAGSLIYLLGLLFYGLGSKREWMHSVFHVLCLIGSVIHCICICGYVI